MQWLILGGAGASLAHSVSTVTAAVAVHLACIYAILFDTIDISAEITLLAPTTPIDLWDFDMSFKASKRISIGLHAQAILIRDPSRTTMFYLQGESSELTDTTFMALFMAPFSF